MGKSCDVHNSQFDSTVGTIKIGKSSYLYPGITWTLDGGKLRADGSSADAAELIFPPALCEAR